MFKLTHAERVENLIKENENQTACNNFVYPLLLARFDFYLTRKFYFIINFKLNTPTNKFE